MMTSKPTLVPAALLIATAVAAHAISAAAQSSNPTIWSGVFSVAQATRGEAIAGRRCASCHNADLAGGQDGPALVGADVLQAWSGTSAGDLFDKIRTTMPADAPQTLSAQETADIVAFIFSQNKCPAGDEELPSDIEGLKKIQITPERKK